jgi:TIR domain
VVDWLAVLAECESKPQKFIPIGSGPYHADLVPGFVRGAAYQDMDQSNAVESLLRRIRQVWHDRVPRSGVFVSYAHGDDDRWLDGLLAQLQPLVDRHRVRVWTDRQIAPGEDWHLRIQNALDLAKVGVMLVSPKFLESTYITSDELPKMLRAAESEGLKIFWVPVVRTDLKANPIGRFQAARAPDKPLAELSEAEGEKALADIVAKLGLVMGIALDQVDARLAARPGDRVLSRGAPANEKT